MRVVIVLENMKYEELEHPRISYRVVGALEVLLMTRCHKEFGLRENLQSYFPSSVVFLALRLPTPKPP